MGDVYLVCSQKRDIGKTVFGIKTGIELSKKGKNVLFVDLSSGNKKISEYLDVEENIIYDIKDVLDGICSADQAVINIENNLNLLPFPRILNKIGNVKRESFTRLILDTKDEFDAVIVDIDSILQSYFVDFDNVDGAIILTNNDFSSIKEINSSCEILDKFGIKKIIVILNKYDKKNTSKGLVLKLKEIKRMINKDISGIVEENSKFLNMSKDFLFSNDKNAFSETVDIIINNLQK